MDIGAVVGGSIGGFIFLIIMLLFIRAGTYIVHQAEGIVVERFGRFHRVLNSGINFIIPFVDRPRAFSWLVASVGIDGKIHDEPQTGYRIDLRESMFNFLKQEVYTKDTVLMDVNALMYYRIFDIKKAIYEVDDLQAALSNTAQTQLKEVFGNMTFSEALRSQTDINVHLQREFSKLFAGWGIHVERMELLDLMPKENTQAVMKKQMIAERMRRGEFIRSEGKKTALRLEAEGEKAVKVNMGIAQQEATRKISEGESDARVQLATAESRSLEMVAEVTQKDGASQTKYLIAQRYMEMFGTMVANSESRIVFLPYDVSAIRGAVADLHNAYGADKTAPNARPSAAPLIPSLVDQFSELN
eukprot:TRINITY_DN3184_c0_g1_i1.p1 TRINITY_DN3184_c0_g1~~TRINITY_DN3184_c0_g1_i1.p1  ORF type:complete len:358 (+),score=51.99 TRINITY_DN3184_c0_g1_i1:34-1107(+)